MEKEPYMMYRVMKDNQIFNRLKKQLNIKRNIGFIELKVPVSNIYEPATTTVETEDYSDEAICCEYLLKISDISNSLIFNAYMSNIYIMFKSKGMDRKASKINEILDTLHDIGIISRKGKNRIAISSRKQLKNFIKLHLPY